MEINRDTGIKERLSKFKKSLPDHITLVAVSKNHPTELLLEAYNAGQRIFGENRAQEMSIKQKKLPKDIEWHFIGHLQKNKIRLIAPYVSVIQGVDSFELLEKIDSHAKKSNRVITCLLQIHIAQEASKFGFTFDDCREMLKKEEWRKLSNINFGGVMGMATFTDNMDQVLSEFRALTDFFNKVKKEFFPDQDSFKTISIGMSEDYTVAIKAGSNMIRIGSLVFGQRD